MPHKKTSTCPNPYTVYRSLKKQGRSLPKYDEWKARLMVIAGGKKSTFKRLVAQEATGLPKKTLKETYARKLRSIAKDIRKDMRHRFKVDRDCARKAVTTIIETLADEDMEFEDDSTVVSKSTAASRASTIKVGGEDKKYVPNPKSIYDALKKEGKKDVPKKYDEWKARYVAKAGGPTKKRVFRAIMADLANELNNGKGISIIRSVYVQRLRRAMREIAKDIISCKHVTRDAAKEKVRDLLMSMAQFHDDDISTIVSHANSPAAATPFDPNATIRKGRPTPFGFGNPLSPSGSVMSGITAATGLDYDVLSPPSLDPENRSVFSKMTSATRSVFGKVENVLQGLPTNATEEERKEAAYDDPMFGYASYRQSSFNGIPPSFYPRSQWRGIAPRRW